MTDPAIIYAYSFDADGNVTAPEINKDTDLPVPRGGYSWLHLCASHPETRDYLEKRSDLEPIIIDAMLARETRPRALVKSAGA